MRATTVSLGFAAGAGLGYALLEARAFTLRRFTLPVLPAGAPQITILHVSDIHLLPRQRRKLAWVQGLAALEPDLVVSTGDSLAAQDAVPAALEAHQPLLARPGAFVMGSNDYYGPRVKNPAGYLRRSNPELKRYGPPLPTDDLIKGFSGAGWLDLNNARGSLEIRGLRLDLVGVDDPHLRLDRYQRVAAPADPDAALTIGVMHAPYRRVLDGMTADGAGLLLAGHTHGGQLCLPWFGTLVTNCDLPRRQARGVSRWKVGTGQEAQLHVCAGLGTSPYTPVRFACRPEASLLTLTPAG